MYSDTQTTVTTKTISVEEKLLVLTFTPEEVKALLSIGNTSKLERLNMLNKACNTPTQAKHNDKCANLLSEMYFAACDFTRSL